MKNTDNFTEISAIEMMEEQYREAENKDEIDFWIPLSKIIIESMSIRNQKGLSQSDLAKLMKTKQSVISRFENMGRKPNYNFISRLAIALGHPLGMTLYGDFMAVVPEDKQAIVKELAKQEDLSTETFTQELLNEAVKYKTFQSSFTNDFNDIEANDFLENIYKSTVSTTSSFVQPLSEKSDYFSLIA